MNKLNIISQLVTLFRLAKKQPLVCMMIIMVTLASFKQEAYIILEYYGVITYEQYKPVATEEQMYGLMEHTKSNVVSLWSADWKVPQSFSQTAGVASYVDVDHIPNQQIPTSQHPEMVVKFYSDECYAGQIYSGNGFYMYVNQGLKYAIACPIVGEDRILKGFTMTMYIEYPSDIDKIMTTITKFNKTTFKE